MFVLNDVTPIGRFSNEAAARRVVDAAGITQKCWFVHTPDDLMQLSEVEIRRVRATLKILAEGRKVSDMRLEADAVMFSDPAFKKRMKNKHVAANLLFAELEGHKFDVATSVTTRKSKMSGFVKVIADITARRGTFRATLDAIGDGCTVDQLYMKRQPYPLVEVRNDLRRALAANLIEISDAGTSVTQ